MVVLRARTILLVVLAVAILPAGAASAASVKRVGARSWQVTFGAPAQHDLSLARLDFSLGARARHATRKPLVIAPGATGLNYVAGGRLLQGVGKGKLSVVMVAVNRRPTGSLAPDLAQLTLTVSGSRLAHPPVVGELANAYARRPAPGAPMPQLAPVLCAGVGAQAAGTSVAALYSSGAFFTFSPSDVLAQGLDVGCGQQSDATFDSDVTQPANPPSCPPCGPGSIPCCATKLGYPCPLTGASQLVVCPQPA